MGKWYKRLFVVSAFLALGTVLAGAASADIFDLASGWPHPNKYGYMRELFTGAYPVVNDTVDLLIVDDRVMGDGMTGDDDHIYVPAATAVTFHITSLDANYLVKIKSTGNSDPLLEVAVSGNGEGAGALTRGLGLKEVKDLLVFKEGKYKVCTGISVVPQG